EPCSNDPCPTLVRGPPNRQPAIRATPGTQTGVVKPVPHHPRSPLCFDWSLRPAPTVQPLGRSLSRASPTAYAYTCVRWLHADGARLLTVVPLSIPRPSQQRGETASQGAQPLSLLCVRQTPCLDPPAPSPAKEPTSAVAPGGPIEQPRLLVKRSCSGVTQEALLSGLDPQVPLFQVLASSDTPTPDFRPYSKTSASPHTHFKLPVRIETPAGSEDTVAMVDSGATHDFIDSDFTAMHSLPQYPMSTPRRLLMADGTESRGGLVSHESALHLAIGPHSENLRPNVTKLGNHNLVLGMPWLRRH